MVSTRGVKFKFSEGEKVLCYEPDPSKAKVLYDSKVLEVVPKGRKVEYLIHFQGWNSSWDRCVPEEFVLRDTEENRQLQRNLAEKAQLQLKERRTKPSSDMSKLGSEFVEMGEDLMGEMLGDVNEEVVVLETAMDLDDDMDERQDIYQHDPLGDDDDDDDTPIVHSTDDAIVPLEFPDELKRYLILDWNRINNKHMLVRLPANPSILTILETYVKDYAQELLVAEENNKAELERMQKPRKRQRRVSSNSSCDGEEVDKEFQHIEECMKVCKEVAQSLRVYIDFMLEQQLLYLRERSQHNDVLKAVKKRQLYELKFKHNPPPLPVQQRLAQFAMDSDSEKSDTEAELLQMISAMDEGFAQRWNDLLRDAGCETDPEPELGKPDDEPDLPPQNKGKILSTVQSLNSPSCSRNSDRGSGVRSTRVVTTVAATSSTSAAQQHADKRKSFLEDINAWKILSEEFLQKTEPMMSQVYGAIHLTRLLVKLPQFLGVTKFPDGKIPVIQKFVNHFSHYLAKQTSMFGDQHYYTEAEVVELSDSD